MHQAAGEFKEPRRIAGTQALSLDALGFLPKIPLTNR
jgi:hypothetical protein